MSVVLPYRDREEAGQVLAGYLTAYANRPDVLVLALPRGGVPVGFEVARELKVPLDVFLVRKLGLPGHPELAMGAIASGGVRVLNDEVVGALRIPRRIVDAVSAQEQRTLEQRERAYRGSRPPPDVRDRTIILVDDGLATGATMRAAIAALKLRHPAHVVVAVPIAAPSACNAVSWGTDDVVCPETRDPFYAVGFWYQDFGEVTDEEVRGLLERAARVRAAVSPET